MKLAGSRAASDRRHQMAGRRHAWTARSKQGVVALVLVGSAVFAGPVPDAAAEAPGRVSSAATTFDTAVERSNENDDESEQALGALLAVEYAGAVAAPDVEALVRRVARRLRQDTSPPERLLRTTEAVCRRALTDFLARRVALPVV